MDEMNRGYTDNTERTELRIEPRHGSDDLALIRADIQQTRERMGHTVEEIGERLNPDRVKQQLKQNIHDATIGKAEHMARVAVDRVDDTRHSIMDSIRDNPIPSAMVGIGLGWLILNGRRHSDDNGYSARYDMDRETRLDGRYRYEGVNAGYYRPTHHDEAGMADQAADRMSDLRDSASDLRHSASSLRDSAVERGEEITNRIHDRATSIAHEASDTVSDVADRAQEVIGHTASRARSMAGDLAQQTRDSTHRMEDRFEEALRESPLAVGAAAVAIGLAVGLTAPSTRRESELMGGKRDELLHRAKDAASDLGHRVQEVAGRAADEAASSVRDVAREEGLTS